MPENVISDQCAACKSFLIDQFKSAIAHVRELLALENTVVKEQVENMVDTTQSSLSEGCKRMTRIEEAVTANHKEVLDKIDDERKSAKSTLLIWMCCLIPIVVVIAGALINAYVDLRVLTTKYEKLQKEYDVAIPAVRKRIDDLIIKAVVAERTRSIRSRRAREDDE